MARPFSSITVKALIEILKEQDQDAIVAFESDYGDHHHTRQVHSIEGEIEEQRLSETAYSCCGWAVAEEEEDVEPDDRDDEGGPTVLVLT